ncbi:rap guanine nucleotide exchange factor 6 isoform X1 [Tachysurus ichikawai]
MTSTEDLTLPISEVADSGRGSWTSCSSNPHEHFQNFQVQGITKHVDMMNQLHHHKADTVAVLDDLQAIKRLYKDGLELNHSRQSWASFSSVSERCEENNSTIKHRERNEQQSTDPAYKMVTSTTEKGLIVYCVTSPCKDDGHRALPPTPLGYQGLSLRDMQAREGGALRPDYLKPPNYSVALQRSKLLGDSWRVADGHQPIITRPASVASHAVATSEDEEQVSAV